MTEFDIETARLHRLHKFMKHLMTLDYSQLDYLLRELLEKNLYTE